MDPQIEPDVAEIARFLKSYDHRSNAWMRHAACAPPQEQPVDFWPARNDDPADSIATCNRCPGRLSCLAFALVTSQPGGIWGGKLAAHRNEIAKKLRAMGILRHVTLPGLSVRKKTSAQYQPGTTEDTLEQAG